MVADIVDQEPFGFVICCFWDDSFCC